MPLVITEAMNLYVGPDVADSSKHRNLMSITLPTFEEKEQDHYGAGSVMELAIGGLGYNKLESSFKLAGHDRQVLSQLSKPGQPFTAYGLLRDKSVGGKAIGVKAIMWGRLGRIAIDEFSRGGMQGHDHAIREIVRYGLYYDGAEKLYADIDTSDFRVDGVPIDPDYRRLLALPGA